jgi:hypothetical protein
MPARVSTDNGATWNTDGDSAMLGTVFTNDTIGIRSSFDSLFDYTTNGGQSWSKSQFGSESWQPVAIGKARTFLAASETFIGTGKIYKTNNGGINWFPIYDFNSAGKLTGTIRGNDSLLAVQTDKTICVSTDIGQTWASICGPGNDWDTRFYLHGDTIFAGDIYGNVWMTPTAHRGPIYNPLGLSDSALFFFTSICGRTVSSLRLFDISNCHQDRVKVTQVTVLNENNRFYLDRYLSLPDYFDKNREIKVDYYPANSPFDTAELYIQYQRDSVTFDTTITLYGQVIPSASYTLSPSEIKTSIPTLCTVVDTFIEIINAPCDTVTLTDASVLIANGTEILGPTFPVILPPDSACYIHLRFQSHQQGFYNDTLFVGMKSSGTIVKAKIPILIKTSNGVTPQEQLSPGLLNFGNVSVCKPIRKIIKFHNPICRAQTLVSCQLNHLGSGYSLISSPITPSPFLPGDFDSVVIEFAPTNTGLAPAALDLTFDYDGFRKDTSIYLLGIGTTEIASNLEDTVLDFDTTITCDNNLKETYLDNNACDSVRIESAASSALDFTVIEPVLPCWVHSGERKKILVRFNSTKPGSANDQLDIYLSQNGARTSLPLLLRGVMLAEPPLYGFSSSGISFGLVSACNIFDTTIQVYNPMRCDSLTIDSVWTNLDGDGLSITLNGSHTVAPTDSTNINIHFIPSATSSVINDTIFVRTRLSSVIHDTALIFSGVISGARKTLDVISPSFDFGTVTICENRDTAIVLSNNGCDELSISSIDLSGSGFSIAPVQLPVKIGSKQSLQLAVHQAADTSLAKQRNVAVITIRSDASLQPTLLSIQSKIIYPIDLNLQLKPSSPLIMIDSQFTITLKGSQTVIPGLESLDFDLAYNPNMLSFESVQSQNVITSPDGTHFHISGSPQIKFDADSSIGKILFQGVLSKDTETVVSAPVIHPNSFDPSYELCALNVNSVPITLKYDYLCGDKLMEEFLRRHLTLDIISMKPNPVAEVLNIDIFSAREISATLRITNTEGKVVYNRVISSSEGEHTYSIPIKVLPEGQYSLEISNANGRASSKFIKVDVR